MSNVPVQKTTAAEKTTLPVFAEIEKRFEEVRRKAHEFFEKRGGEIGRDLDDWLAAEREVFGWAKAEMTEADNAYKIEVTLPGFEVKDVQVTAAPDEIVVRAATEHEKREEKPAAKEGERVIWSEFGANEVYRRFEMPKPVDTAQVTAHLEKGILHIAAPCAAQTKTAGSARQVKIVAA